MMKRNFLIVTIAVEISLRILLKSFWAKDNFFFLVLSGFNILIFLWEEFPFRAAKIILSNSIIPLRRRCTKKLYYLGDVIYRK